MKKAFNLLILIGFLNISTTIAQNVTQKLEVIYFHSTRRCPTCLAIEENAKKTLDTYFKDLMKNGTIRWNVINVDEEKNSAIAEKYEATGSALFLTKISGGKEIRTDLTEFAFSYARSNPDKFIGGLKDKINAQLK
jgi:hypothetical protein